VWVQPGARQDAVVGILDGCLKIRVAAPAVDNKANLAVVAFIAARLHVRRSQVHIVHGKSCRRKKLRIDSTDTPAWNNLFPAQTN
jgi:uncharacterized protein